VSTTENEPSVLSGPVKASERIASIDVLRGFAVLGILIMNVQSFSMIGAAYLNPNAYGDLSGANYMVWFLSHLLADSKFMTIFSLLFGAGVVLMAGRREAAGKSATGVHYRRMLWLIVFGAVHGLVLWYGDILWTYGLCGLLIYLFRRRSNRTLIVLGLVVVGIGSLIAVFWQATMPYWPPEAVVEVGSKWWAPPQEAVEAEVAAYRGGWSEQQSYRGATTTFMMTNHFLTEYMWRAGGLMLIGMALFRLGVFSAVRSRGFYLRMTTIGFGFGLPIVFYGVLFCEASEWSIRSAFFGGSQFNYWASLLVAMGWIGLVMLACKDPRARPALDPLAAVGRMALSCYLLQTIICTTIFYGHGFGLYGAVSRVGQAGVVLAVWTALLIACPIWLRHFRFGPFEWLWRSLTYWKLQPMQTRDPRD
jgi:uncharacterized protein